MHGLRATVQRVGRSPGPAAVDGVLAVAAWAGKWGGGKPYVEIRGLANTEFTVVVPHLVRNTAARVIWLPHLACTCSSVRCPIVEARTLYRMDFDTWGRAVAWGV